MRTGIIILAAGSASRMGKAKMLLPFSSTNILSHILQAAKIIKSDNFCIVTGFYHSEILQSINDPAIDIVFNENWQEGMASSIKKGLMHLLAKQSALTSVLLLVADQPYLNEDLLKEMYTLFKHTNKGIVAAKYGTICGTPVLFHKKYFTQLLELTGDKGAKSILQQNEADSVLIDFPMGIVDIDTIEDYENLCVQNVQKHA